MSGSGNSGTDRDDAEPDGPQVADARAGEPADDTQAPAVEAGDGWLVGAWSAEGWKAAATAPPRAPEPPDGPTPADGPDGPALHSAASGDDVAADARPEASGPDTAGGPAADHRAAEDSGAEGSAAGDGVTGVAGGGAAEDRAGGDRAADGDATGDTAADVSAAGDALSGNGGAGAGRADDGATGAGATGGSAVGDGVAEGGAARGGAAHGGAAHGGAGDGSPAGGDAAGDTAADVSAADVSAADVSAAGDGVAGGSVAGVGAADDRAAGDSAADGPSDSGTGDGPDDSADQRADQRAGQHADTAGPGPDEPDAGPVATERVVLAEGPRVPSATATSPAPPLAPAARRSTAPADLRPAAPGPPPPPSPPSPSTPPTRPQAAQPVAGARGARTAAAGAVGLSEDAILRARDERPEGGWRGLLYSASGGRLNPGIGPAERLRHEQLQRIRRALPGSHHVAIGSIKGGVGKTSVAAGLGLVLAESRGDRVIALDANPDAGTLADRLTGDTTRTVRDLLTGIGAVGSLADVAHYASLAGRLQVLASEQDPAMSAAFDRDDYERVCAVLTRFYDIVITDSGPGLVHSAMEGTLALADTLVIVGAPAADGVSRASKTLDWLVARGHAALVADALIVLSCDRSNKHIDTERVRSHFATRCRAVVEVPFDPHLATGARIELGRLRPATHEAFLELAAHVADGFPPHGARPVTASSRG